mgnify:CR=1 FL=1
MNFSEAEFIFLKKYEDDAFGQSLERWDEITECYWKIESGHPHLSERELWFRTGLSCGLGTMYGFFHEKATEE